MNKSTPPIHELLPHDAPMVLLDHLISYSEDAVQTSVTLKETSPFCENGVIPAYIALEYMAQCIGAWSGMRARLENSPPQIGFLLGTRKLVLNREYFKVGETLDVFGHSQFTDGEMAYFQCKIEINGEEVAAAGINVFQPKDTDQLAIMK